MPHTASLSTQLTALRKRAIVCLLHNAEHNDDVAFKFWSGYALALRNVEHGSGQAAAEKDARSPSGYEPPAHLQAAWAALPVDAETLTIAQVQQILAAQGVKLTRDPIAHGHFVRGQQLKGGEAKREPCDLCVKAAMAGDTMVVEGGAA